MNRRTKLLFTFSLVLNLFFAGMILGNLSQVVMLAKGPPRPAPELLAKLPEEKRVLFEKIMKPSDKEAEQGYKQIALEKEKAVKLLKAEPFSADAYMSQTQHIGDLYREMKQRANEKVIKLAQQFTPEERSVLAELVSRPPPRPGNDPRCEAKPR